MAANRATSAARKASLVWLVGSAVILIGGIVFGVALVLPKYVAFLGEPTVMSAEKIINANTDDLPIYNVQVTGSEMIDTGYYYEETYLFIPINNEYFGALWLEDQFLLVRRGGGIDESMLEYNGTLRQLDSDERVEIIGDLEREVPDARGLFLPVVLDVADNAISFENLAMAAAALGAIGFGLYGVYRGGSQLANPAKHPFLKSLSRYGDPEDVVNRIDKERVLNETKVGKLTLTNSWIVFEQGNNFRAIRAQDLLWVYKHVQSGRYGSKHYSLRLYDAHGEMVSVAAKNDNQADEMGRAIAQKAPWTLIGYDKKIEDAWKKQRDQLVAAVEQRKAQAS